MNDKNIKTVRQVQDFLKVAEDIEFKGVTKEECYRWITSRLIDLNYFGLNKAEKGDVQRYLIKMTGYSRQQMTRLIGQYRKTGRIEVAGYNRRRFVTIYKPRDILLLASMDELHQNLSGPATKKLCERAFEVYKQSEYERLSTISVAHIYNLRKTYLYRNNRLRYTKTQRSLSQIGERKKPEPSNQPGFLRIDTVHQGDEDKQKGVYHINLVDEVTQWEIVCSVEKISESYLIPVLEFLLDEFPFVIKEFHSDNGSEYVNKVVAKLLKKLLVRFTKSRARKTNDNALIEGKNGSIVRKHLGYGYIDQKWAPLINEFNQKHLNPYLNFHRPCFFPKIEVDKKGKQKKMYPYENIMTPYDKLKSLPNAKGYLKPRITFEELDKMALSVSDNDAAKNMNEAKQKLFKIIFGQNK